MMSPKLANWVMINGILMMAWFFFLQFTRLTRINVIFYRLLGMKVGRSVIIDTVHVYDVDLLEIGDGAVVGGDAVIMAHVFEEGSVYYKRVRIASRAEIGFGTIVLPGADIGEGTIVGAKSLVPKNTVLPSHTIWAGVPVRKIDRSDRKSAQEERPRVISTKC
jgi:acetyltransferase-like isoleucine patch superfamily enzyme